MNGESPGNGLQDLERHRLRLEENTAKLRRSLQHWRDWEIEYEGLKEEYQRLKDGATASDMIEAGKNFGSNLVTEKELQDILRSDKSIPRSPTQVAGILSRRVDYVQQNIQSLQKQIQALEEKLELTLGVKSSLEDDKGLPLMEILEELDEDGNVISGSVSAPGDFAPQIAEALKKVGITEIGPSKVGSLDVKKLDKPKESSLRVKKSQVTQSPLSQPKIKTSNSRESRPRTSTFAQLEESAVSNPGTQRNKSVTFAEELQIHNIPAAEKETESRDETLPHFTRGMFKKGERIVELDENDDIVGKYPVIPDVESPEDAASRREMLAYALSETNAVVAELDLEEGSDFSYSDDDYEEDYVDTDIEDEDGHGRTKSRVISDEYHREMQELEKKLNAKVLQNVGPTIDEITLREYAEDAWRLGMQRNETNSEPNNNHQTKKDPSPKKMGVRFAESLDIARPSSSSTPHVMGQTKTEASNPPISEQIVERLENGTSKRISDSKSRKVSRFKSELNSTEKIKATQVQNVPPSKQPKDPNIIAPLQRETPTGPTNAIVSREIIERDVPSPATVESPSNLGELEPALHLQQVALEYHRQRNRMIQRQGGFLPTEEEEEAGPWYEEKDGVVKKVSHFKAAKLRADGAI